MLEQYTLFPLPPASKRCSRCGETKDLEAFDVQRKDTGYRFSRCRACLSELNRAYQKAHPEKLREYSRRKRAKNPERHAAYNRDWAKANPDKVHAKTRRYRERHIEEVRARAREAQRANRQRILEYERARYPEVKDRKNAQRKERLAARMEADPTYAARYRLDLRMANAINKTLGGKKGRASWEALVGYSLDELMAHLEAQFEPGMTWHNRGTKGWHIDHIQPRALFNYTTPGDAEFRKCWALENLRPLWAVDNLRKGARPIDATGQSVVR